MVPVFRLRSEAEPRLQRDRGDLQVDAASAETSIAECIFSSSGAAWVAYS